MRGFSIILAVSVFLLFGAAQAGSLGKYSGEQQQVPVMKDKPSAEQVEQRLNEKIARAIEIVNSMDAKDKSRWVERYRQRYNEALENNNYTEAAYYRAILTGITKPE